MPRIFGFILFIMCAVLGSLGAQERRVALVIGNGAYKFNTILKNPVNDAVDMEGALKAAGFQVTLLKDAGRPAMEKAIRAFGEALKDEDAVGLFYYSGHGAQAEGQNFLLPVDADIADADELRYKAVDAESVLAKMRSSGNKLNLVFLDACRNNPFPGASKSAERGLSVVKIKVPESIIVYATDPGAVALDGSGRNSPFTQALLENIRTPGLGITQLMMKVTGTVKQTTGGTQTPWVSSNLSRDFAFYTGSGVKPTPGPTPAPQPVDEGFVAAVGSLSITLATAGTVTVAGKTYDFPGPGTKKISGLSAEDHTLQITYKDGKTESRSVAVTVDQVTPVAFSYKPAPVTVPVSAPPKTTGGLIDMVRVEGGTFMMGKDARNPGISTTVSSFWIGRTEVTQGQWKAVMGSNPSYFKGDNLPVENVRWYDAVEFCNKLSQKEGLSPAYNIDKNRQDPNNKNQYDKVKWAVTLNAGANGYRLATEAQWEFAARGGNASRGSTYSGGNTAESQGWIDTNSGGKTQAVGTKGANVLGIYDMSGNVWEWCGDWYTGSLSGSRDPGGPSSGAYRVLRGGGWGSSAGGAPVSHRNFINPDNRYNDYGFRLVRP